MNLRSANWQRSREYCKIVFAFEVQQIEFPSRTNRNWLDFEQKIKEPGQFWAYELTWTSTEVLVVQAALSEAGAGLLLLQLQQLLLLPLLNTTVCAWALTWSATEVLVVRAAVSEVGAGLVAVAGFAQGLLHHAPTWPWYYGWDSSHCHILCHGVMEQVSWCHAMSWFVSPVRTTQPCSTAEVVSLCRGHCRFSSVMMDMVAMVMVMMDMMVMVACPCHNLPLHHSGNK